MINFLAFRKYLFEETKNFWDAMLQWKWERNISFNMKKHLSKLLEMFIITLNNINNNSTT